MCVVQPREQQVVVDHVVAEMVVHFLHVKMIDHGKRVRKNDALVQELDVSLKVVFNVGLLRKELRGRLCGHNELVH